MAATQLCDLHTPYHLLVSAFCPLGGTHTVGSHAGGMSALPKGGSMHLLRTEGTLSFLSGNSRLIREEENTGEPY